MDDGADGPTPFAQAPARAPGLDAAERRHPGGDEATRLRIRAEARRLFERYGYAKTTIGEIAEVCAMSPGNLYRYYLNKQAIGHAVVEEFVQEHGEAVQAALEAPADSVEARLRATMTAQVMYSVRLLREAPKLIELAEMIFSSAEGREMIERLEGEHQLMMEALMRAGAEAGEFASGCEAAAGRATTLCLQFFNMPFGLVRHGLDRVEIDLALALDLICAGLRQGLAPPGAGCE
ncbi:MAG: TetR/AcrR family transcriptional regulator [Pseudomonadota bacterium]